MPKWPVACGSLCLFRGASHTTVTNFRGRVGEVSVWKGGVQGTVVGVADAHKMGPGASFDRKAPSLHGLAVGGGGHGASRCSSLVLLLLVVLLASLCCSCWCFRS